jgi:NaMN:DMB phosphoribosyltransferase
MNAIAQSYNLPWQRAEVVVGTTRWVAEDPTGGTVELALNLAKNDIIQGGETPPLIATQLSFADSRYPQLQAYEQGFVKEGMGAGGSAIAASLSLGWQQPQLLAAIEQQFERLSRFNQQ